MRFRAVILFACACAAWCCATAAAASEAKHLGGRAHYSLREWGSERGLTASYRPASEELWLTNRTGRLVFKAESKRMTWAGVGIALSHPIRRIHDDMLVSDTDLHSTLNPLANPPSLPSERRIKTIAIGAGHGGRDPGNIVGTRREKDYTLKLAQEVSGLLKKAGFKVVLPRASDTFVGLEERPVLGRQAGADLYVSLHFNAFRGGASDTAKGAETFCLTPAGAASTNDAQERGAGMPRMPGNRFDAQNVVLAWHLQRAIQRRTPLEDRGVKRARFQELTLMPMPAVLVEGGFMTHPEDGRFIFDWKKRRKLAEAIVDGIQSYQRAVELNDVARNTK